jgi:putative ABC transport system substrate-binding protein
MRRRRFLGAAAGVAAAMAAGSRAAPSAPAQARIVFLDDTAAPQGTRLDYFREALQAAALLPGRIVLEVADVAGSDVRALRSVIGSFVKRETEAFVTTSAEVAVNGLPFMVDIPLVTGTQADPLPLGLENVPGPRRRNVTGFTFHVPIELKSFEVMADAFPAAKRIAVIADRPWMEYSRRESDLTMASERFGMKLDLVIPASPRDVDWEFDRILRNRTQACYVPRSDMGLFNSPALIAFFQRERLPNLFAHDGDVFAGALMSYGVRRQSHWLPMAQLLRNVLAGIPARELPFERPKDFLLGVNATQAARMGIAIPKSILRRASFVV